MADGIFQIWSRWSLMSPIQRALLQCEFVTPPSRSGPYSPAPWIWVAAVMLHDLWYKVRKSQKTSLGASILLQHLLSACSFSESSYHRAQATRRVYMSVPLSRVPANLSHPSQAPDMWVKELPDDFNPKPLECSHLSPQMLLSRSNTSPLCCHLIFWTTEFVNIIKWLLFYPKLGQLVI